MRPALGRSTRLGRREAGLLAASAGLAALLAPVAGAAGAVPGKAGLLITGQSNAGFFLEDGGIWVMNEGLAALLSLERARFDPRLDGFRTIDGYALRDGAHRDPAMATTYGGTPLWAPGDRDAFLVHQSDADPSRWERGTAGRALDRFVRELLAERDRAECLGILWLQTESDSRRLRLADAMTHAAAIRRHLDLIRAAFGRRAEGAAALPAYGWSPIPYGDSSEGHRAVRAALAAVANDASRNFRLAVPQTADSEARGEGRDWSHRDAQDLRAFARRAAYAIAHHQRERHGRGAGGLPGPGPRISGAVAENARTTIVTVAHDRGHALKASLAAADGRGWSVFDQGRSRPVSSVELGGADRIVLRHEGCTGPTERRAVGYCLLGEQLGRGNAITDDWGGLGPPPTGLDAGWRFDFPLQATLLPVAVTPGR